MAQTSIKRAVILASGGLDSTVAATVTKQEGYALYFLTVSYGQRHRRELDCARAVGQALGVCDHRIVEVDLRAIGGSSLTSDQPVPKDRSAKQREGEIPSTYVPGRNTIFLALATAYAETVAASRICIGANVVDYSGYPDCRPEFLRAFEGVARLGTKQGQTAPLDISAPLLTLSKKEIIALGVSLQAPLHLTHSCYDPDGDGIACGRCDSCVIRLEGFWAAGLKDPVPYAVGRASV
ncbi:MAG: 7-cyano-7-deazaguanine synthase QueC [Nitrospiraceae bacterium]